MKKFRYTSNCGKLTYTDECMSANAFQYKVKRAMGNPHLTVYRSQITDVSDRSKPRITNIGRSFGRLRKIY